MKKPYSADGSTLDESCQYKDGYFRIGPTEDHQKVRSLTDALQKLEELDVARWRHPSATSGILGTVTAVRWA